MIELFLEIIRPSLGHKGKLSSVEATQLLHKAYLTRYSLATETELTQRPASLVKMRDAENAYLGSLLEDHFDHFLELEIFNYMSWDEYIVKPRHEMEMIRRAAEKRRQMKNNKESNSVREAEKIVKQMGMGG